MLYFFISYEFISYLTFILYLSQKRMTYKKEGNGLQCDTICEDGYTFNFYFRYQKDPNNYIDQDISTLRSHVLLFLINLSTHIMIA